MRLVDPTAVVIGARSVVCVAVVKDGSGASGSTTRDSPNLECLCPVRRRAHPVHDWGRGRISMIVPKTGTYCVTMDKFTHELAIRADSLKKKGS